MAGASRGLEDADYTADAGAAGPSAGSCRSAEAPFMVAVAASGLIFRCGSDYRGNRSASPLIRSLKRLKQRLVG
jgi:hypothetical protein